MKRILVSMIACAVVLLNFAIAGTAQAQPLIAFSLPPLFGEVAEPAPDLLKQLETEILPQLEGVLSPTQRDQFKDAVAGGTSFRKAFKALTLTPAQKGELGGLFKTLPKKDIFASLTPDQKKQLFMKKKDLFMPTPEEIGEKISEKMKMAKDKASSFAPSPEAIGAKISEKMKMAKDKASSFAPSPEAIGAKISEKMKMAEDKLPE